MMEKKNGFSERKNCFHELRKSYFQRIPNDFIFVDTETFETEITSKVKHLKLKLGWLIHWDRLTGEKKEIYFETKKKFWNYIDNLEIDNLYLFAHNTEFDFKILDGYTEMILKRQYTIKNIYIEGKVFILSLEKDGKQINIYDTYNYCPTTLKIMGKSIGLEKAEIDFKYCTKNKLKEYCLNDTRIIQLFMEKFILFLQNNNLGGLKATISSCAFNGFRNRFYDRKNNPILIHAHNLAIKLERDSYKGGLCDCIKVGTYNAKLYKLDVNSMYPYIMSETKSPVQLIFYSRDKFEYDLRKKLYKELKGDNIVIARIRGKIDYSRAHLITRFKVEKESKNGFLWGEYDTVLTTPELLYLQRHGKILDVYELSVYRSSYINKDYVDFFYKERLKFRKGKDKNEAFEMMCKLFLNSIYGKWGQKGSNYILLTENAPTIDFIRLSCISPQGERYVAMQFGRRIYKIKQSTENSFDSLVAIASLITAHARMYLIKLLNQARRENCYYMDTDCLIVNEAGFSRLKKYIDFSDNKILGKLEIEGISEHSTFYKPKYYIFSDVMKCKGVRKNHKVKKETKNYLKVEQEQFQKFKTAFNENTYNLQKITLIQKQMSKIYNKGVIIDGSIYPYHADDVEIEKFDILDF